MLVNDSLHGFAFHVGERQGERLQLAAHVIVNDPIFRARIPPSRCRTHCAVNHKRHFLWQIRNREQFGRDEFS